LKHIHTFLLTSQAVILFFIHITLTLCAFYKGIHWGAGTAPPILTPLKGRLDGRQSQGLDALEKILDASADFSVVFVS
jgi:hypothetical protein